MGSSSSPLRRKLGFEAQKKDGVAKADTVVGRILGKEVGS